MDETLRVIITSGLALIGVAASTLLGITARTGPRHRLENLKLAGETLTSLRVRSAQPVIRRFIAREEFKLADLIHPDTRKVRIRFRNAVGYYLLTFGLMALGFYVIPPDAGGGWVQLVVFAIALLTFIASVVWGIAAASKYSRVQTRRKRQWSQLDRDFYDGERFTSN